MARPLPTSIRLAPEIKQALERAAADDGRSVSNLMDRILRAWLTEHGYLPKPSAGDPPNRPAA